MEDVDAECLVEMELMPDHRGWTAVALGVPGIRRHDPLDRAETELAIRAVLETWAARRAADPARVRAVHQALLESRAWGLAHLDELVAAARNATALTATTTLTAYLSGLDYAFGYKHLAGLTDFFRRLAQDGIVPDGSLQFLGAA